MMYLVKDHIYFLLVMTVLNLFTAHVIIKRFCVRVNRQLNDALLQRNKNKSFYKRYISLVRNSIEKYEKRERKSGTYVRAKEKMKKSGYKGSYTAVVYIMLKYVLTGVLVLISLISNYPSIKESLILGVMIVLIIEAVIKNRRKKHNLKFQRYIYKIYKYLHNQVSSGVKITDAVKSVYEVIEDRELKGIFIQLAARYDLTLDIDTALDEFKSNFDVEEAETLCVALKQGIMTGDNTGLLARQEEVMFSKYFNYIQAETDNCRLRGTLACAIFTTIVVVMISVPLLNDVKEAVSKIFIN